MVDKESRGTRLSEDWTLGTLGLNYAQAQGLTVADAYAEAEKFKSYFLAASGPTAIKRNWLKAWQYWILNALRKYGLKPNVHVPTDGRPTLDPEKRAELAAKYSKRTE